MRQIKFRAWGPNLKHMWSWKETQWLIRDFGFEGEKILLQYAGFKDKSGTEVFEGDILKINYGIPPATCLLEVVFVRGQWLTVRIGLIRTEFPLHDLLSDDLEVVGNIYETPELLGAAKCLNQQ